MDSPAVGSHFLNEDAFESPQHARPMGVGDDGDVSNDDSEAPPMPVTFRGKKISALEAYFRECATMHDIIQVYWDHAKLFHGIELAPTSGRECDADQKVKDLTREIFLVQGEVFDMHIFDEAEHSRLQAHNQNFGSNAGDPASENYLAEQVAAEVARKDHVTECFRRVVARLNGAAQEEFSAAPDFGRKLVPRVIQAMTRTLHGGDSYFLLAQIFGGFCRSSALRGKFARVLLTPHDENPDTEITFDQFSNADGGHSLVTASATVKAYSTFQVHVVHDEDGSGDGGFAMDDQAEALLLRTVTVERFVGTFDQPKEPSADSVLGAPRKYSESREISIRYEPVDRYRGVSRVLLRTSVRQWLDRMLALPSQVREYRTEQREQVASSSSHEEASTVEDRMEDGVPAEEMIAANWVDATETVNSPSQQPQAAIERRLVDVATLGVYRVRAYFHHWVVVARIMTLHGMHLRKARHRQRDKYLSGIVAENKRMYGEWESMVLTFDNARSLQDYVQEQKILRYQIAEHKRVINMWKNHIKRIEAKEVHISDRSMKPGAERPHYTLETHSRKKHLEKDPERPEGWVNIGKTHANGKKSYNYGATVDQGWHIALPEEMPPEWGLEDLLVEPNSHQLLASFERSPKPVLRVLCRYGLTFRTLFTKYALPSHRPKNRSHEAFAGRESRFIGSAVEVRDMVTMAKDTLLVPEVVAARAVVDACKLVGGAAEGQRDGAFAGEALPVDFRCMVASILLLASAAYKSEVLKKTKLKNAEETPPHVQLLWFLVKWDPTGKLFDDAKPLLESASAAYVDRWDIVHGSAARPELDKDGMELGGKLSLLFRHYANQGPRKDQLTAHRFYRVVQDMGLMGRAVTHARVDIIFQRTVQGKLFFPADMQLQDFEKKLLQKKRRPNPRVHLNAATTFSPRQFREAIYYVATLRFGGSKKHPRSAQEVKEKLSEAVDTLLGRIGMVEADYWENTFEKSQAETLGREETSVSHANDFEDCAALLLGRVAELEET